MKEFVLPKYTTGKNSYIWLLPRLLEELSNEFVKSYGAPGTRDVNNLISAYDQFSSEFKTAKALSNKLKKQGGEAEFAGYELDGMLEVFEMKFKQVEGAMRTAHKRGELDLPFFNS